MAPKKATEAAIYCRISSDPQGERAGVERQRKDCEALADKLGATVVRVYTDNDISAYTGKRRPDFEAMLNDAANGDFGLVIVWATDRLYRRMTDLTRITDELAPHARIASVNGGEIDLETSEGILRAQVLGSVAEFESRRKSERLTARAKQRAESGTMTASNRPFGWTWTTPCPGGSECGHRPDCEGTRPRTGSRTGLVPHSKEATELAATYRNVLAGATLQAETKRLRAAGYNVSFLRTVLLSARNAGLVSHRGNIVAEATDTTAIVDVETFNKVSMILKDPARRTSPGRPANTALGGGLLRCGACGGPMAASRRHGNPTYICSRNRCLSRTRKAIDEPVLKLVGEIIDGLATSGALHLPAASDTRGDALRTSIADDEDRLDALATLLADGQLDPADYAKAAGRVRENLAAATGALVKVSNRPALADLGQDVSAAWAARLSDATAGDTDWMRAALRELIDEITLNTDKIITIRWKPWVGPAPDTIDASRDTPPAEGETMRRRQQVKKLHAEGVPGGEIARRLKVNRSTIVKDLRLMRRDQELAAGDTR